MLPTLLLIFEEVNGKIAELLNDSQSTILCSSLTSLKILVTSDPANVRHMMSTNFSRYPKGTKWREGIDTFGPCLPMISRSGSSRGGSSVLSPRTIEIPPDHWGDSPESINQGLIPVLQYFFKEGMPVDLQDLFQRHIYDITCKMTIGDA
ncbi:hypothetical protein SLE2022_146390 [Rubroshorea leprosula]